MSEPTNLNDTCAALIAALPRHKCSLTIEHNQHLDYYQGITEYLTEARAEPEEIADCVAAGEVWTVHWYPDTPIGSYIVHAGTLAGAIRRATEGTP